MAIINLPPIHFPPPLNYYYTCCEDLNYYYTCYEDSVVNYREEIINTMLPQLRGYSQMTQNVRGYSSYYYSGKLERLRYFLIKYFL